MEIIEIELDDIIMTSGEPNDIDTDDIDFQVIEMKLKQSIIIIIMPSMLFAYIARFNKKQNINNNENEENTEEFKKVDENGVIYLPEEKINPNN